MDEVPLCTSKVHVKAFRLSSFPSRTGSQGFLVTLPRGSRQLKSWLGHSPAGDFGQVPESSQIGLRDSPARGVC
jgi:hypothetical protein